jgi:hypothetical protein
MIEDYLTQRDNKHVSAANPEKDKVSWKQPRMLI